IDTMRSCFIRRMVSPQAALLLLGAVLGVLARELILPTRGDSGDTPKADRAAARPREGASLAPDTASAYAACWERPYPQYQPPGKVLKPCPDLRPGELCPQDVSIFGGAGRSSYGSVDDVATFEKFYRMCSENKARVLEERHRYLDRRYHFS